MSMRAGSLAIVFSFFLYIGGSGPVSATESDEQQEKALPQACFDTANTAEPCQILYRYAELFSFANIPDYVGFVESVLAEARGESPLLPLLENPEIKRFMALREELYERDEQPTERMILELEQFMSHWLGEVAEFRHAPDGISLRYRDFFFSRLVHFNDQLFPETEQLEAIEKTFLRADLRMPNAFRELSPIADGEEVLTDGVEPPMVLVWLASSFGFSDEYAAEEVLLELVNQHRYGGNPFDLPLFDQRPGIGPLLNMPLDAPIEMTEKLSDDIAMLANTRVVNTSNELQNIHLKEYFAVNNLLSLLTFAEGIGDPQPRIPYARSRSIVDLHVYVDTEAFAQIRHSPDSSTAIDANLVATILALRLGAQLPVVGSQLVQLEDMQSGDYVVIALTPLSGNIIYTHTAGYESQVKTHGTD